MRDFKIFISEDRITRLKSQIALTDFPTGAELVGVEPWSRGPPLSEIRRLTNYWMTEYDWRKHEEALNKLLPQFATNISIDGFGDYEVHFVHQRSAVSNAIPLLFLHGWPGSFIEVSKLLSPLTNGDGSTQPAFHVVAPSLIDHGFSSGSRSGNFNIDQHAEAYHKLMLELGYPQYVAQGGDTGYLLARILSQHYPSSCVAHHINMACPSEPSPTRNSAVLAQWKAAGSFASLSESEREQFLRAQHFQKEGSGYFAIHSTRPLALAYAMTASPVSMLAWVYDKLHTWSDGYPWTEDEIITWVSIYIFAAAGPAASFTTYFANQHRQPISAFEQAVEPTVENVAVGLSRFPREIMNMPRLWSRGLGRVVFEAEHAKGGHFAAWECPRELVNDLRDMFGRGGGAEGVVNGHHGYLE